MKNFFIVLKFELSSLIKKKAFLISTAIIALLIIVGLTIPTIKNAFTNTAVDTNEKQDENIDKINYGVIIENDSVKLSDLKIQLPNDNIIAAKNKKELNNLVISDDVEAGFIIKSPTKYEYLVKNTSITDDNSFIMDNVLLNIYRNENLKEKNIDANIVSEIYNVPAEHDTEVLGKDSMKNYIYTYALVFALYFIIIMYGQLIATSIASEKSNRTMEILITSTNTKHLIFGKVIAGAIAGILQFGIILATAGISYKLNANAWNHKLDFIFNIPSNVLITFSIFGILGYLFYLFAYGTIGALVSKTEDVNTSSTPITIIFILAFFVSIFSMQTPDSMILKIASFVPLSSFMAMFIRVSMGNVSNLHIAISLILLAGTTGIVGILGAKIYELGSLMYGNPVKLKTAIKLLKQNK